MVELTEIQAETLQYLEQQAPVGEWFVLYKAKVMTKLGLLPYQRNAFDHRVSKLIRAGVVERCPANIELRVVTPLKNCRVKKHFTADTMVVEYESETILLADLCARKGVDVDKVYRRMTKYRWSLERALAGPVRKKKQEKPVKRLVRYAGWEPGAGQWA